MMGRSGEPSAGYGSRGWSWSALRSTTTQNCLPRWPSLMITYSSSEDRSSTLIRSPTASSVSSPVAGSARWQTLGSPASSLGSTTTTRCPLRVHGPSSACCSREPAIRRASLPPGRPTQTWVRTPPSVATQQASQAPSADQLTETTGSSDNAIMLGPNGDPSPLRRSSSTQTRGTPLRSLIKATREQSGSRVGPQLPQPSTRASASTAAASSRGCCVTDPRSAPRSAHIVVLQPHLEQGQLPQGVGAQGGAGAVRFRQQIRDGVVVEESPLLGAGVGQGVTHALKIRPVELPDGRHREISLGAVDHLVRDDTAARALQHALATVGQLELRRDATRELVHLVVEEGHPCLQTPSHGHVVDPFHGVVDEHDRGVVPEGGVDRVLGPGPPDPLRDERGRRVLGHQPLRVQQRAHRVPAPV